MKQATFPRGIDSSMRSAFVSCPQKWFMSYCMRLQQGDTSIHLLAGGAFAAGCEAYRLTYFSVGERSHNHDEALHDGYIAIIKHWGDRDTYEGFENKSLWMMLLALEEYFTVNHPDIDIVKPYFIKNATGGLKPCVEVNFALPIPGTKHPETGEEILYVGRYDMIAEFNQQLYIMDEKTTSRLGPTWAKQWELRGQFIGYCWSAREYGIPVVGAIIRGMSILKSSFGHAFAIEQIKPFMIDRWLHQLARDVNRITDSWVEYQATQDKSDFEAFDRNFGDACSAYSGCEFKPLCLSAQPEAWIPSFSHNPWDPLKSQEEMFEEKAAIDAANQQPPVEDY